MYPHMRFAAYLIHMQYNLDKFISPLPVPGIREIASIYPNIPMVKQRGYTKWRKINRMTELLKKTDIAIEAYKLWKDPLVRRFLSLAFLRSIGEAASMLKKTYRVTPSNDVLEFYRFMFFDIDGCTATDLLAYSEKLRGEDARIFSMCIKDISTELILKELGIQPPEIDIDYMLEEMIVIANGEFISKKDIRWGKFMINLIKARDGREDEDKKNQNIFNEMKFELKARTQAGEFIMTASGEPEALSYAKGPPPSTPMNEGTCTPDQPNDV